MPPGAFVKQEDMPPAPVLKEEAAVPPMPSDAFVKTEAVVKEEERSGSWSKRQRAKSHPLRHARTVSVRESVLYTSKI